MRDEPRHMAWSSIPYLRVSTPFPTCESACAVFGEEDLHWLVLAYQLVLPHVFIRVILKINHKNNIYNYLFHALSSIEYSNTYYKIYIYHNIVAIDFIIAALDFILHHISMYVWYIYLINYLFIN